MAPGLRIKEKQSVYQGDSLLESTTEPPLTEFDEPKVDLPSSIPEIVQDIGSKSKPLSPRLQKLVDGFKNLPWFEQTFGFKTRIVWLNVMVGIIGHVLMVYGVILYGTKLSWCGLIFYPTVYLASGVGVTAGAHRLWSHKSYKAKMPLQITLMLFNCISMQNSLLEWCRDHRVHHKYTETDADPHNALRGFFFAHMGWLMMKKHPDVFIKGQNIDMSDLEADPVIMFQHRHYRKLCLLISVVMPTVVPWLLWGEDILVAYFIHFLSRYILTLHSTWLVNSAAHLWGDRPYDKGINPSDNRFVCLSSIGEGWHNYHHTFPYDYSTSEWGPKFNMTTIIIDIWASLGLAYARKQVSQEAIERVRKRLGNLSSSHSNGISPPSHMLTSY